MHIKPYTTKVSEKAGHLIVTHGREQAAGSRRSRQHRQQRAGSMQQEKQVAGRQSAATPMAGQTRDGKQL